MVTFVSPAERAQEAHAARRRIADHAAETRRRIVRDLHDGAQQRLVALMMHLRTTRAHTGGDPVLAGLLDAALAEAQGAIDDLRDLAAGLYPATLQRYGLAAAVRSLADRTPVPTWVEGGLPRRPPVPLEVSAYFAVAEAVTNAVKHAQASRITVSLATTEQQLAVAVADDGIGGATLGGSGSGLIGVLDRIGAHTGEVEIDSPTGRGTTIRIRIPLPNAVLIRSRP
jgi:signal transduction histidine kinase